MNKSIDNFILFSRHISCFMISMTVLLDVPFYKK
jgi:hypothetical protein